MKVLILFIMLCGCTWSSHAATINAASTSYPDVNAAVAASSPGDTVVIPAGTGYWTNWLDVDNKSITLQGSGTNQTILVDEMPANRWHLIKLTQTNLTGLARITGIQFRGGVTNTGALQFAMIYVLGSNMQSNNSAWRIDNCLFVQQNSRPVHVSAWAGLIDSNVFSNNSGGIMFDCRGWGTERGDLSWATPVRYGTTNSGVYVEGNYFTNATTRNASDSAAGPRWVYRYNTMINAVVQSHGTESTGRARGLRSVEIYGNNMTNIGSAGEYAVHLRSGTGLMFSNNVGGTYPGMLRVASYRMTDGFEPWLQADGTNVMDWNDPTIYATGTHTGTNGATVLIDSNANYTVNQWVGYTIQNTTRAATTWAGAASTVSANTQTSISRTTGLFAWSPVYWTNGEAYRITKVIQVLDAPGVSYGVLLSDGSDSVLPTPAAWPYQTNSEPIYYWNNVGITDFGASTYDIVGGRNYTNTALAGYVPLVFPHPLAGGGDPVVTTNSTDAIINGNLKVGGGIIIRGP